MTRGLEELLHKLKAINFDRKKKWWKHQQAIFLGNIDKLSDGGPLTLGRISWQYYIHPLTE